MTRPRSDYQLPLARVHTTTWLPADHSLVVDGVSTFESVLAGRTSDDVTESWLERETLEVLRVAGLPPPVCQARIARRGSFAARVDFLYAAAMLVIEVSGHRWHRTKAQMRSDLRRRRALTLTGHRVLEYSYTDVVQTPQLLVAEVVEALGPHRHRAAA